MTQTHTNASLDDDAAPDTAASEDVFVFPVSFAQQRLWFLHQLEPHGAAYNVPVAARLKGRLDLPVLEQTLGEIIRRHEVLRTTFDIVDGEPVQLISAHVPLRLSLDDLSALPADEREAEARRLAQQEVCKPFDLTQGPLVRPRVLRLDADDHVLLITLHHIVSDGWSMGVLVREIGAFYTAFSEGRPSPLEELPVQYADYAQWQREWLCGATLDAQLDYWRHQLKDAPPVLELPTDRPRPPVQGFAGEQQSFALSESVTDELRKLCQREGATLYMLLLAAFKTLLYRYTNQTDILVGSPIAGRNRQELESLIGFFINTLVLRTDLSGNPTFRELLARVREVALGAFAHQDVPFEKLVEEFQTQRDLSHMPLVQVLFALQNTPEEAALELPELTLEGAEADNGTARFDLSLNAWETERTIEGFLRYKTELFDDATVRRLLAHFRNLLVAVAINPDRRISDLPLLNESERAELLAWNSTRADYALEQPVHALFEAQAERQPDAVAVVGEERRLTYAELNAGADAIASYLRRRGVGPEVRVGLCLPRGVEMVVALLGVLKAGGCYVPLEESYPPERVGWMTKDARARIVLTTSELSAKVGVDGVEVVEVDRRWAEIEACANERPSKSGVNPENAAYVIYTSGSTGKPKGVVVSHRALLNYVSAVSERLPVARSFGMASSFAADLCHTVLYPSLCGGGLLHIISNECAMKARALQQYLDEHDVECLKIVPSHLFGLEASAAGTRIRPKRVLVLGGEATKWEMLTHGRMRAAEECLVVNHYGPTETTVGVLTYEVRSGSAPKSGTESVPLGRPLANTQVYILDEQLEPLPTGICGQLYIGGEGLARGYLNRPDLTAERFIPHPFGDTHGARLYRTGDLARRLPSGDIEFLGRVDNQVKIRGFRIELGEIEAALGEHEGVRECVVMAREEEGGDKRLVAYLVWRGGGGVGIDELRSFLKGKLPEYMIPTAYVVLDAFPLTPNGKLDRRALPAPGTSRPELNQSFVAPTSALESALALLWQEMLRLEKVGIHDNFFELGGDSIKGAVFINRLQETLGRIVPVALIFTSPTVAQLAGYLTEHYGEAVSRIGDTNDGGAERAFAAKDSDAFSTQRELGKIPRLARDAGQPLPLSFGQQRLFFLDRIVPRKSAYNIPMAVRIHGALDVEALMRGLNEIVRRHESLRTSFPIIDGVPSQRIEPRAFVALLLMDLSKHEDAAERESRLLRLATDEARLHFDLQRGPLLRTTLVKLGEEDHALVFNMHHIISDGWSNSIFTGELAALYDAYATREQASLPELSVQYADFAAWQRAWLEGAELESQMAYWKKHLAGASVLQLPTDRARPPAQTFRGADYYRTFSPRLSAALRELARREGVTLFMLLLAAFDALLYRYTGQHDIVVGSPIAGRTRAEIEHLIGFFVNTLVLRTDLSGNPTFRELLRRVHQVALGAYAHQDVPFEKLVEELQLERDPSRTPLFQVLFAVQNAPRPELKLISGLTFGAVEIDGGAAKFDLSLAFRETDDLLSANFEYNTDLFDASTVERMMLHLETLLEAASANPDRRISDITILTEQEKPRAQVEARSIPPSATHAAANIHALFERQAEARPDDVALISGEERVTYGELNRRANRLAHHLRSLGVETETLVGILSSRSTAMIVALLGVLKAGGAYVPLDPAYPQERLRFMLEDARVSVLLTERLLLEHLPAHSARIVLIDEGAAFAAESEENLHASVAGENLAYVIYTSGSTGRPKGVAIAHSSAVGLLRWAGAQFTASEMSGVLASTSICFDLSVFELFAPLARGGKIVLAENALALAQLPAASEVALVNTVPSAMAELIRMGGIPVSVRTVNLAGEPLKNALVQQVYKNENIERVLNLYGPSEDTTYSTVSIVERGAKHEPTIGRPITNTDVYLLDEHSQIAPVGVAGELYIGGEGLARGYLNRPDLTAERFIPHPFGDTHGARLYRTGDLARRLPSGDIEFLGRVDNQVKIRGFRIELGEIEAALGEHEGVRECVVTAREDAPDDKRLVAYLVAQGGDVVPVEELRAYLRTMLPEYMIPTAYVVLDAFPLTPNGKLDRRALPAPANVRDETSVAFVAPRNESELQLARIWEDVLNVRPVGVRDNFFDLGGHSLLAVKLFSRIEEQTGSTLPLSTLFESPTIEQQVKMLRSRIAPPRESSLVAIRPQGAKPPLFFMHSWGGNVLAYNELARRLDSEQPVYGLQARGVGNKENPHASIEEMAAAYLSEIRSVQPRGPYRLCGWSSGGLTAFELARQLDAQGEAVNLVALIDAYDLTANYRRAQQGEDVARRAARFNTRAQITTHTGQTVFAEVRYNEEIGVVYQVPTSLGLGESRQYLREYVNYYLSYDRAIESYLPRPFGGRVVHFLTADRITKTTASIRQSWDELARGGVEIHDIPGEHFTLLKEPHVGVLADKLKPFLS